MAVRIDQIDERLLALLRQNARASIAKLAGDLGVTRTTIRSRLTKLENAGHILGYGVRVAGDRKSAPIEGLTLIKILGLRTRRVIETLRGYVWVHRITTTNGKWDLIVDIATDTLGEFDNALNTIRSIDGVEETETSLRLAVKHQGG